ncbi:MAG: hypothetical protein ACI8QH_000326, partial [Flammeovirgaceae bacterium]
PAFSQSIDLISLPKKPSFNTKPTFFWRSINPLLYRLTFLAVESKEQFYPHGFDQHILNFFLKHPLHFSTLLNLSQIEKSKELIRAK